MDSIDLQLIALLRQDARATVATLAKKLGVSRGTVTNRVKKLEDEVEKLTGANAKQSEQINELLTDQETTEEELVRINQRLRNITANGG